MKGKLVVISGFSGVGKGTIVKELVQKYHDVCVSISATTRTIRDGEIDGVNYFFINKNKFEEMIKNNDFLEYAQYVENYYGTPKQFVVDKLSAGQNVILEIEMDGAFKVKKTYSEAILIYIMPPSAKALYERLQNRGTEDNEQIEKRLKKSCIEAENIIKYDYIVENDDLDTTVQEVYDIIKNNKKVVSYDTKKIKQYINDIKEKNYV